MQRFSLLFFSMFFLNTYSKTKFLVCYGKFDVTKVVGYDLLILESANFNYTEIEYLKKYNKKVVAYISLGEVNEYAKDFKVLKNTLGEKNTVWNSYYLDIASEKVTTVLKKRIKNIYYMGFDGLFLDNIDNYTTFGVQKNLKNNLIQFIASLKTDNPDKILVQNAGLELVPELHNKTDYVLVESIFTNYSFEENKYQIRDIASRLERLDLLKKQIKDFNIKALIVEYALDKKMISTISKVIKKEKIPFVIANINLQNLPE